VREESHLDDMRSAIRGDFERLAERRGGQELMRASADQAESTTTSDQEPVTEPRPEAPLESEPGPEPETEQALDVEPEPAAEEPPEPDEPVTDEPQHRSWLDRLRGR
jgi:hypothetical protein